MARFRLSVLAIKKKAHSLAHVTKPLFHARNVSDKNANTFVGNPLFLITVESLTESEYQNPIIRHTLSTAGNSMTTWSLFRKVPAVLGAWPK